MPSGRRSEVGDAPSPRQADMLRAFRAIEIATGMAPSMRELEDALGLTSTNAVNDLLQGLARKGYAEARGRFGASRRWRLTQLGVDWLVPQVDFDELTLAVRCPHCGGEIRS